MQLRWTILTSPYRLKISLSDLTSLYTRSLLNRLLVENLDRLNSEQLVFCIFLSGLSRKYPRLSYKKIPENGFELPTKLGNKLEIIIPHLDSREVGIISHGLHLCYLHLARKEHKDIINMLWKKLVDFPDQLVQKNEISISSIAKILKNRGEVDYKLATQCVLKYQEHLHHFGPYTKLRYMFVDFSYFNLRPF